MHGPWTQTTMWGSLWGAGAEAGWSRAKGGNGAHLRSTIESINDVCKSIINTV